MTKDGTRKLSAHDIKMCIANRVVRNAKNPQQASYAEMARYAATGFSATVSGSTIVCKLPGRKDDICIDGTQIKTEINRILKARNSRVMTASR